MLFIAIGTSEGDVERSLLLQREIVGQHTFCMNLEKKILGLGFGQIKRLNIGTKMKKMGRIIDLMAQKQTTGLSHCSCNCMIKIEKENI